MLAIFDHFLNHPENISKIFKPNAYSPLTVEQINDLGPKHLQCDQNLLWWHKLLFANEFILRPELVQNATSGWLRLNEPADFLSYRGQQMLRRLKKIYE